MSTTEVTHRGAVIPVVWVKNVAERFISSLIVYTFIKPPSVAYSDKIYRHTKKKIKNVQGLSLTDLHGSDIIWGNRKILSEQKITEDANAKQQH